MQPPGQGLSIGQAVVLPSSHATPVPCVPRAGCRRAVRRRRSAPVSAILAPISFLGAGRGGSSAGNSSSGAAAATEAAPVASTSAPGAGLRPSLGGAVWTAVTGTQAFAGQLWGSLKPRDAAGSKQEGASQGLDANLLADVKQRAREAEALERKAAGTKVVPSLEPFLKQTGVMETRYVRKLSNLCALTYRVPTLTARDLWKRHKLTLVTTSLACDRLLSSPEVVRTPRQVFLEADAMAASTAQVEAVHKELEESQLRTTAALQTLRKADKVVAPGSPGKAKQQAPPASPTDLVAAKLVEAAAAAASAAAPLANNITTFTSSVVQSQSQTVASAMQSAAAAGHSTAVATMATVTAAVEATWGGKPASPRKELVNPTDWYVVDDGLDATRYFVLMGSDNFDHWRTNLTFDPVDFEDAKLGAKVHRGVYEAAQVLYERFLPLVEEHVRGNPFAKIAFTGHSLGGSISTLLLMMYVYRGVLSPVNLQTTYTFGSPAIFCEGGPSCGCAAITQPASPAGDGSAALPPGMQVPLPPAAATARKRASSRDGLLARLGLKEGCVKNVVMHRDIVPRAFACDYSLVADLLRRVGDSFKEHSCLRGPHRQAMYYFVGRVLVLQPDERHTFVKEEGYHPSLPAKPGLWLLREPSLLGSAASAAASEVASLSSGDVNPERPYIPANVVEAVHNLMDTPHPLDILGDPEAYGNDGSISRYHNPDNYTRAIGGVLRTKAFWRLVPPSTSAGAPHWYMPLPLRGTGGGVAAGGAGTAVGYVSNHGSRRLPLFQLGQWRGTQAGAPDNTVGGVSGA